MKHSDGQNEPAHHSDMQKQLDELLQKAIDLSARQNYSGALHLFIRMLEIKPEQPEIMFNAAVMCDQIGETHTAIRVLQEALQLKPEMSGAWLYLGKIYMRFKQWSQSRLCIRRAIQFDIDNADAYVLYRNVMTQLGLSVVDAHTDLVCYVVGGGPFHDRSPETGGIGGTETAVVFMMRELARMGKRIKVFTQCDRPGMYNGVEYFDLVDFYIFNNFNKYPVFLAVRSIKPFHQGRPNAKKSILWIHDNPNVSLTPDVVERIDRIIAVSEWHKQQWMEEYDLADDKIYVTRNGVDWSLFAEEPVRDRPLRLVFTSQPHRGLERMLTMFPQVRARFPQAELHVFWYPSPKADETIRDISAGKDMTGVVLRGSVGKRELADELMAARVWVYPTAVLESSCMAAIEAQAAGTPVVSSRLGALPETVLDGKTGFLVDGAPDSADYQENFLAHIFTLLDDVNLWQQLSENGRSYVHERYKWSIIAREWQQELL